MQHFCKLYVVDIMESLYCEKNYWIAPMLVSRYWNHVINLMQLYVYRNVHNATHQTDMSPSDLLVLMLTYSWTLSINNRKSHIFRNYSFKTTVFLVKYRCRLSYEHIHYGLYISRAYFSNESMKDTIGRDTGWIVWVQSLINVLILLCFCSIACCIV